MIKNNINCQAISSQEDLELNSKKAINHKLIIIDCYGFLFRAYYMCPKLVNSNGIQVGALYGFASMLIRILMDFEFDMIAAIYDSGGKNFRHELFSEYKSNRKSIDEDLRTQLNFATQVTEHLGITTLRTNGFEADDIIASLVQKYKNDTQITIISSDKDLMQLIDEKVLMYDGLKKKYINRDTVYEKFQVYPEKLLDYFAIVGDSSDNIPGIKGLGPKAALQLLSEFENIDEIYNKIDQINSTSIKNKIYQNYQNGFLSKKLLQLRHDVDIREDQFILNFDYNKALHYFEKLNFDSLIPRLKKLNEHCNLSRINSEIIKHKEIEIYKNHDINSIIEYFKPIREIAIFIEINRNSHTEHTLENVKNEDKIYLASEDRVFDISIDLDLIIYLIIENHILITQDITCLFNIFKHHDRFEDLIKLDLRNVNCLNIMHYICFGSKITNQNIAESFNLLKCPINGLTNFSLIFKSLQKNLLDNKMLHLYRYIDLPIAKILAKMEFFGIKVDIELLKIFSRDLDQKLKFLESKIYELSGEQFNINSPKQLSYILFEKLKLLSNKKHSTDISVLEEMKMDGIEIANYLIKYRELSKLKFTYADGLQKYVSNEKIHTTLDQTLTITGRLSSSSPNLQNLPTKLDGLQIKECFIPEVENQFISIDYSQIELRILSIIGNVSKLCDMFSKHVDVHEQTATELFGQYDLSLASEYRRKAKTINFGIIYGMNQFGLAKRLHISNSEAKIYIDRFFSVFPEIKLYMKNTIDFAKQYGYVENIYGRRIVIDKTLGQQFFERSSINAPIQSTASDIVKLAMLRLEKALSGLDIKMILQVHDEIIFECNNKHIHQAIEVIKGNVPNCLEDTKSIMNSKAIYKNISLPVNIHISSNLNFAK